MIRIFALLLTFLLAPLSASAEVIVVNSGEHVDFSRLVMQFPEAVEWQLGRTAEGQYALRVDRPDVSFDTSSVYTKIPRTRIERLESGESQLVLSVPTNVHGDAFELRAGRIVIDIKDGAPEAESAFETVMAPAPAAPPLASDPEIEQESAQALAYPEASPVIEPAVDPVAEAMPEPVVPEVEQLADMQVDTGDVLISAEGQDYVGEVVADRIMPEDRIELPIIVSDNEASGAAQTPSLQIGNTVLDEQLAQRSERVDELEQQLLEQIGRAVSQGLLDADVSTTERAVEETRSYQEEVASATEHAAQRSAPPEEILAEQDRSHIRIESSIDREQKNRDDEPKVDDLGTQCLGNRYIDVASWGAPLEDGLELANLRAKTIGEFDLPDPEGVKRLARYYIYLTFGAEAKSVLTDFGVTVEGADLLWALAEIMDQGYAENPGRLAQQYRCDGTSAFWSVMSKETLNNWEEYNMESVLATFSALPIHLRRHLGPKLSERFLEIGDEKSAKDIQNTIARAEGEHGDAFDLLDAELKLADGDVSGGVGQLETIVGENGPNAPEALVKLIATQANDGGPIDRRTAENAEAMAVEFRGSPYEATLRKAAILARIYSGDVDLAVRQVLVLRSEEHEEDASVNDLLSQALEKLVVDTDDPTFSKIVLGHITELSHASLTGAARLRVSERLVNMGFFDPALSLMAGYTDQEDQAAKMILARAFYGEGEMEAAIRYASQVDTDEAKRLVSKAYFQLEDPEKAIEALDGLSPDVQSDTLSLVAEDWERLEQSSEPGLSGLADVITREMPQETTDENGVPSLKSVEDLLSNSREARDALEAVLN